MKKLKDIRPKHNRSKSDIQLKSASLLERFITHVQRKESAKNSFKEDEQLGTCFEIIEEEREERQPAANEECTDSKKLMRESGDSYKDKKPSIDVDCERKDNFQTTHKTDVDFNLQTSHVTTNEGAEDVARIHSEVFARVNRHEWRVLAPQRDIRLGLLQNRVSKIGLVKTINGHIDAVRRVDFLDSATLFSAGEDGIVKEWRLTRTDDKISADAVNKFRYHAAPVFSSAVGEHRYFTGDAGGRVVVMNRNTGGWALNRVFSTGNEPVWCVDYCGRDNVLISTTPNKVKFWSVDQLSDKKAQSTLCSTSSFYTETRWLDAGQCVMQTCDSAYSHSTFTLYDANKEAEVAKVDQELTFANSFKLLQRDNLLVAANDNHTVSVYDTRDFKLVKSFIAHSNVITALDVQQDSHTLITGDQDGSMRLWDLQTFRCVQELSVHRRKYNDSILDIKIQSGSQLVATAGADSTIRLFSLN